MIVSLKRQTLPKDRRTSTFSASVALVLVGEEELPMAKRMALFLCSLLKEDEERFKENGGSTYAVPIKEILNNSSKEGEIFRRYLESNHLIDTTSKEPPSPMGPSTSLSYSFFETHR